jgi:signal transduction histidine kinase
MAKEELKKVELWAETNKHLNNITINPTTSEGNELPSKDAKTLSREIDELESDYTSILGMVISQNTTIPMIVVEPNGKINLSANISYSEERKESVLNKELNKMKKSGEPMRIDLVDDYLLLYYRQSSILRNLRYYPFIQLLIIIIFIIVAYLAFSATQRAEQNQVWVGMSKETAHQLGTPISSLMAWIELLRLQNVDENLIKEFEKDTQRLERITERFSKIGSKPELLKQNLIEVLSSTVSYLKTRSSNKVIFETSFSDKEYLEIPLNAALFSWVIENLCKNAIDAMGNNGTISINLKENEDQVYIDITDTGIGVAKSQFKTIFQPGYSTKKRGWGLGLSLAKRIVEIYHNGKIFIKSSEIGKGTRFRIIMNK